MGQWTPEQTSTLFLAIFFLAVIGGCGAAITSFWFFWKPLKKRKVEAELRKMEAEALKIEADSRLADSLVVTTTKQTSLTERTIEIGNEILKNQNMQTVTLNVFGQIMNLQGDQVRAIAHAVGARIIGPETQSRGPVTFQPAVEVDSAGKPHPVTVVTETIREQERKTETPRQSFDNDVHCSLISCFDECPLISSSRSFFPQTQIGFY